MTTTEYLALQARLNPRLDTPAGEGCANEAKLHEQIIAECRHRGFVIVHSRMDRRATVAVGTTDFVIAADGGRTFWIECKTATGKLTREQEGTLHWLRNLGHIAEVVRSLDGFMKLIEPT